MSFGIDNYIVEYNNIIQKEKILNQLYPFNPEESVVFNKLLFEKRKKEKQNEKQKEEKEIKKEKEIKNEEPNYTINNNQQKEINPNIILKGIIKKRSSNKCFICEEIIYKDKSEEILPCKCNISFCSDICKENYYQCLESFFNDMEFGINIKCGNCEKNICRTSFIENINFEKENVKNALKNKMEEFFEIYCMNCLTPISLQNYYKIIKCKCPGLLKLLGRNKFEHRLCFKCSNSSTGNCKICDLYHSRLYK